MDKKTYSVYLSQALDALGFSYDCIKHRQTTWELCGDYLSADEDGNVTDIVAGSKAEGVSRVFEGDYDLMVSLNDFICYGSADDMKTTSIKETYSKEKDKILNESTIILYQRTKDKPKYPTENVESFEDDVTTNISSRDLSTGQCETKLDSESLAYGSPCGASNTAVNNEEFHDDFVEKAVKNTENKFGQYNGVLLMDTKNVLPGYTILQVLYLDEHKLLDSQVQEYRAVVNAKTDRNGMCVLSSLDFSTEAYECDEDEYTESIAGPAGRSVANKDHGVVCDTDSVFCIPCDCKRINRSWVKRKRKFNWPSKELIEEIACLDGHVVPVGFKGSETSQFEWRICYTKSEIKLVQSFNETQIQLHALVKIVGKNLLQPKCPDITSYILKNLLLWMAEKIPTERFKIEHLYGLLLVALKFLRCVILERNLPNYMIPERNLFYGKLPEDERIDVLNVLDEILNEDIFFIERYKELEFLCKYMHTAANNLDLAKYMATSKLQLEIVVRQNWREVWEDRVYNFLPLCLEECSCLKAIVSLCDMVGVSSKTRQLVIEKMFWWITGKEAEECVVEDNDNAYWEWNEHGDIRPAYESKMLSAEELDAFFNTK